MLSWIANLQVPGWQDKSKNTGWISVDRSVKATLSTYNTWMQLSRLQRIYRFQYLKLWLTHKPLTAGGAHMKLAVAIDFHVIEEAVDNTA